MWFNVTNMDLKVKTHYYQNPFNVRTSRLLCLLQDKKPKPQLSDSDFR